jgi:hypothetical protein
MKDPASLAYRREHYRLWFEYLRLARLSSDKAVRRALEQSRLFYAAWGTDTTIKFDTWWKTHAALFEDKHQIKVLRPGEEMSDPQALVLEIPLTRSATAIINQIRPLLEEAVAANAKSTRKSKSQPTASYRLTAGAEPKLLAIRESLTIYREVCLKNPSLKGHKLLDAVHAYYLSRKVARKAKVPVPLLYANEVDRLRAMRNLNRYVYRAQRIMLNVAKGDFPGRY